MLLVNGDSEVVILTACATDGRFETFLVASCGLALCPIVNIHFLFYSCPIRGTFT